MVSCKISPKTVSPSTEDADDICPALEEADSGSLRAGRALVDANKQSDEAEAGTRCPPSSRTHREGRVPVSRPSRQPPCQGRTQKDAPDSSSTDTRKCQLSNENTREQSNKTPFNVPPTPQRAPGRSGCPSETSIEVPERLRTSLPLAPRLQAAAARRSLHCSSSFPLETVNSARRKRLREEHDDRSCFQTREMRGQMDPLLKIPGAGWFGGQAVCQGRREPPGLGSLLLIFFSDVVFSSQAGQALALWPPALACPPTALPRAPGGHLKGATASVPRAPSAPWWPQSIPAAMAATPPSSTGAGTPHLPP